MSIAKKFLIFYFSGFLAGLLFSNITFRVRSSSTEILAFETLRLLSNKTYDSKRFFCYLFPKRYGVLFLYFLSGISNLGILFVWVGLIVGGFFGGALYGIFLLQMGMKGMAVFWGSLVPQIFIYLPVVFYAFAAVYGCSLRWWEKRYPLQTNYIEYVKTALTLFLLLFWGVVAEAYLNPPILQWILKKM